MTTARQAIAVYPDDVWTIARELGERMSLGGPFAASTALRMLMVDETANVIVEEMQQHRAKFASRLQRLRDEGEVVRKEREADYDAMLDRLAALISGDPQ